ncbi:MAG: hypothetical protein K8T91_00410 [Planctomycetes bacterium]|nr:hypothetical protein [Planctomycetota bacterium]
MPRLVWIVMLAGLLVSGGCERQPAAPTPEKMTPPGKVTAEDVRRDAAEAAQTAAEYSKQNKEEFQKKLEVQLNELDAKIATLREKGRDLKDDARRIGQSLPRRLERVLNNDDKKLNPFHNHHRPQRLLRLRCGRDAQPEASHGGVERHKIS